MNFEELQSRLKEKTSAELRFFLLELYQKIPEVKDYLDITIPTNQKEYQQNYEKLKIRYKKELDKYLNPSIPEEDLDEEKAINLIERIRKAELNPEFTIECEMYFVECCKNFILNYGYFDEDYYDTMEEVFEWACWLIEENNLLEDYRDDIETLIRFGNDYGLDFERIFKNLKFT